MTSPPKLVADLHLLSFQVNDEVPDTGPLIAVDGAAPPTAAEPGISACAAVTSAGAVCAAWWEHPPVPNPATHAEWQALRLGLRFASGFSEPVTIVTDNKAAFVEVQHVMGGSAHRPEMVGGLDPRAIREIRALFGQSPSVTFRYEHFRRGDGRCGDSLPSRRAHTLAWLVRRLAADGIDPSDEMGFLSRLVLAPPEYKKQLRDHCYALEWRSEDSEGKVEVAPGCCTSDGDPDYPARLSSIPQ